MNAASRTIVLLLALIAVGCAVLGTFLLFPEPSILIGVGGAFRLGGIALWTVALALGWGTWMALRPPDR